jgi:hypothetical protein
MHDMRVTPPGWLEPCFIALSSAVSSQPGCSESRAGAHRHVWAQAITETDQSARFWNQESI